MIEEIKIIIMFAFVIRGILGFTMDILKLLDKIGMPIYSKEDSQ